MVSFEDYQTNPTIANRNALVVENLGLARCVASQISKKTPLPYEELEQVAHLALILAVERFDTTKNIKFSYFAFPFIKNRVLNFVRDKAHLIKIPRSNFIVIQKAKRLSKEFAIKFGRLPSQKKLAETLGISVEDYKKITDSYANCRYISSISVGSNSEFEIEFADQKTNDEITNNEINSRFKEILSADNDSPYQILVLNLYFLEGFKLKEIAQYLNSTEIDILLTIREYFHEVPTSTK